MVAPPLPDEATTLALDPIVRRDLRGLQKDTADDVARHLVAAGLLVDDDPQRALEHARYARRRAARIAAVREAAGIAAYHAGEWNEALGELRAARRMGGGPGHIPVMADIERALGRPERAIELARGPEAAELGRAEQVELAIVAAGARRDLGEVDASVVGLQIPELAPEQRDPWSARLFYAYADNLLAADREKEALEWFVHAADADELDETDAARRIAELTGEPLPDDDDIEFGEEEVDLDDAAGGAGTDLDDPTEDAAGAAAALADDAPTLDDPVADPAAGTGTGEDLGEDLGEDIGEDDIDGDDRDAAPGSAVVGAAPDREAPVDGDLVAEVVATTEADEAAGPPDATGVGTDAVPPVAPAEDAPVLADPTEPAPDGASGDTR